MKNTFPFTFWTANTIELFERAAYYAVASFVVIYLNENLGMAPTKSTFLNGTVLWGLIYFLPILSGSLADRFGFKRSLVLAFILVTAGYIIMGTLGRFWPVLTGTPSATIDYTAPVLLGILLIGAGGSFVKPCISGTVQKTSGHNTTVGFAIFYMIINIGSISGRAVSYLVRTHFGIPAIFGYVASTFALAGLLLSIFIFREPVYQQTDKTAAHKPKTVTDALLGMFKVLQNLKFVFFIIVIGFFWSIYIQIYNLIPLYLRFIDKNAPVELYTLTNPVMIVVFQLLITRLSQKWTPVRSIMMGVVVTTLGMLVNLVPSIFCADPKQTVGNSPVPIAGLFVLISIASMAIGEMLASPRIYQYIGAIAPKGQEGLYLGYANLPIALGTIIGAPLGGLMFAHFVQDPASRHLPIQTAMMWILVAAMGIVSFTGLYLYDNFLIKKQPQGDK